MSDVRHGTDGWTLVEYGWSVTNGVGRFVYERTDEETKKVESRSVQRNQPAWPAHIGWRD